MVTVVRLDCIRYAVEHQVRAESGFHVPENTDVARVANGVSADVEPSAAGLCEKFLCECRIVGEQFVTLAPFVAASKKVFLFKGHLSFRQYGIDPVFSCGLPVSPPDEAGGARIPVRPRHNVFDGYGGADDIAWFQRFDTEI